MKLSVVALIFVGTCSFIGCASDGPTSDEVQQQIAQGVRGEGTVTPDIDRSDDPYVTPREGKPPPRE